jgi:UrcA family protein
MLKLNVAAAAVVSILALAGQATAADSSSAPVRVVSTAGVNFQDAKTVDVFYARLRAAAAEVCDSNSANPRITQLDQVCRDKVLARTVAEVNRPLLTAMHSSASGGRLYAGASN